MSGIEVVGIVLAVLPIFISAWEHYNGGLDPAKAFWHWEKQLPSHIRSLRDQQCLYELNIDMLIAPIMTAEERFALNGKEMHPLWKDSRIQHRIKERLGRTVLPFQSNMAQFESTCRSE